MDFKKIKHRTNSWIIKLIHLFGGNAEAMTVYPFVFYKGVPDEKLVYHELVHCQQVQDIGWIKFYLSYFFFYFSARMMGLKPYEAYMALPYEQEAYMREGDWNQDSKFLEWYNAEKKFKKI